MKKKKFVSSKSNLKKKYVARNKQKIGVKNIRLTQDFFFFPFY
jgi:hypothetical protein